ncbi:MAG: hypothetical protein AAGJ79_01950 [Verrucomicrobiota bacterium]
MAHHARPFSALILWDLSAPGPYVFSSQPSPQGVAKIFDLTWLNQPWAHQFVLYSAGIACLFYIWGQRIALLASLPVLFALATIVRTYENSQGFTDHSHQLIALTLLSQTIVMWTLFLKRHHLDIRDRTMEYGWLLYYSQGTIAATYVVAAMSKIMRSTGMWVFNSPYLALDLVKSKRQNYYKYLDDELATDPEKAVWVFENPNLARVLFGGAFFLELFALFALRNRPWALAIGIGLIAMHRGIRWMMGLNFLTAELIVAIFLLNIPFWIAWILSRGRKTL